MLIVLFANKWDERSIIVKKEKLATAQFRINKKHEDVKQYKRTVIEYELILNVMY